MISLCSRWQRPSLIAWLAISSLVLLMCGLSLWQLARLEQKETLIAAIEHGAHTAPNPILPLSAARLHSMGFQYFQVTGEFLHDKEMHLAARYFHGKLGYHVLTPLKMEDGRVLLVNRGWVPTDKKESSSRPESLSLGRQHYIVMLRTDRDHNYFTPPHDVKDNIWFWRDIPAMRTYTGLNLLPVSVDSVMESPPTDLLPIPSDGHIQLRNDHLGYAITWFLVGMGGVAVFLAYHLKSAAKP